ncbi:unnamed protein product, partial [Ectocarpus sp. 12 AP-2014]
RDPVPGTTALEATLQEGEGESTRYDLVIFYCEGAASGVARKAIPLSFAASGIDKTSFGGRRSDRHRRSRRQSSELEGWRRTD